MEMENAFYRSSLIEKESLGIIVPWLERRGNIIMMTSSRELQTFYGDIVIVNGNRQYFAEVKAERKTTGNMFLETFSNGSDYNPGWMLKSLTQFLLYHFLDENELFIADFQKLKKWFYFGLVGDIKPGIQRFTQRKQDKYQQHNDTWGICVPINILNKEIGLKKFKL